jgi:hypothetical protein
LVKSLNARLEVARKHAEKHKSQNDNQPKSLKNNSNNNYSQNNQYHKHKGHHQHHHQRREGHINEIDYEQAKMLKRNFHGDEYDSYGNGSESIVSFFLCIIFFR